MRVLVAEDDLLTLTQVLRIVRDLGHEVEIVRDGVAAWKYLEKATAGGVAILHGMLPGKTGLDIVSELHARNWPHYTYVILLATRHEPCNAIAALEAGADAFLAVPVSAVELVAQLKAAERILKREDPPRQEAPEVAEVPKAPKVAEAPKAPEVPEAPEQPTNPSEKLSPPIPESVPQPLPVPTPSSVLPELPATDGASLWDRFSTDPEIPWHLASRPENELPVSQMQMCFDKALKRLRYTAEQNSPDVFQEKPEFSVYSALVLEDKDLWLDLRMEMERRVATALYRTLMSEAPTSDAQLRDALEEVCNKCLEVWKHDLESTGLQPMTVVWATARRSREVPNLPPTGQGDSYAFVLPGPIRVAVFEQAARVVDKPLAEIARGDILADPISATGQKVTLLKRGSILNARYIARIHELLHPRPEENFTLRVIEPSPLALFMMRRSARKAVDSLLKAVVRSDGGEKQIQGRIRDISENGLGAMIFDPLNPGQTVTLEFGLGGGDGEFRIEAIVRHREGSRCGFEFLSNPSPSVQRLKEAVRGLIA
jgi:CheY-like chemotaxis protein